MEPLKAEQKVYETAGRLAGMLDGMLVVLRVDQMVVWMAASLAGQMVVR
jgi:hypothetical protein